MTHKLDETLAEVGAEREVRMVHVRRVVVEYLIDHGDVYPDKPLPSPDEVHESIDSASEPMLRTEVRDAFKSLDDSTVIAALTLYAVSAANPVLAIYALEQRGVKGARDIVMRGRVARRQGDGV